jgi:hypothetical protein
MAQQVPDEPHEHRPDPQAAAVARPIPEAEDEYEEYEVEAPAGRGNCLWFVAGSMGCVALLCIVIAIALVLGTNTLGGLWNDILGLFSPQSASATVASTRTIIQGIQTMGQLVTISAELAKADISVSVRQGALGATSFTVDHVAQGAIEAGIDLSGITEADVQYDEANNAYTVTLPAARLTSCRVDYIRQYGYSGTILPVDRDAARVLAGYVALRDFRDTALEGGILERAQRQAQLVLGNFIRALTGSRQVTINFRADAEGFLPSSCDPAPPPDWVNIPEQNVWTRR